MRAIEAIEPSGRIQQFASVKAAERAGYVRQSIHSVLKGRYAQHKGLYWRYAGGPAPEGVQPWIDGIDRLPAFVAERCTTEDTGRPVCLSYLIDRFRQSLPDGASASEESVIAWIADQYPIVGVARRVERLCWL